MLTGYHYGQRFPVRRLECGDSFGIPRNPEGYFESPEVNAINEDLLEQVLPNQERWQRWLPLIPPSSEISCNSDIVSRIQSVLSVKPYCYKDPRFCYTLPTWFPFLKDTGFICVFRSPDLTVDSILRECREVRDLHSLPISAEVALSLWCASYERILQYSQHGDWLFLEYNQLFYPLGVQRLRNFSGARVNEHFPKRQYSRAEPGNVLMDARSTVIFRALLSMAKANIADAI